MTTEWRTYFTKLNKLHGATENATKTACEPDS